MKMPKIAKSPIERIEELETENHQDECMITAYDNLEETPADNLEEIVEDYKNGIQKRNREIERIKEELGPEKKPAPEEEGVVLELVTLKKSLSDADDLMSDLEDDDFADDNGEP